MIEVNSDEQREDQHESEGEDEEVEEMDESEEQQEDDDQQQIQAEVEEHQQQQQQREYDQTQDDQPLTEEEEQNAQRLLLAEYDKLGKRIRWKSLNLMLLSVLQKQELSRRMEVAQIGGEGLFRTQPKNLNFCSARPVPRRGQAEARTGAGKEGAFGASLEGLGEGSRSAVVPGGKVCFPSANVRIQRIPKTSGREKT